MARLTAARVVAITAGLFAPQCERRGLGGGSLRLAARGVLVATARDPQQRLPVDHGGVDAEVTLAVEDAATPVQPAKGVRGIEEVSVGRLRLHRASMTHGGPDPLRRRILAR